MDDIQRQLRREARWNLIIALQKGGTVGISDGVVAKVFEGQNYNLSMHDIRSMIRYMEELGFCKVDQRKDLSLWAKITAKGIDLYEGNCDCPESIARPE